MGRRHRSSPQALGRSLSGHPGCLREVGAPGQRGWVVATLEAQKGFLGSGTTNPELGSTRQALLRLGCLCSSPPRPAAPTQGQGPEHPPAHAAAALTRGQPRSPAASRGGSSLREPHKPLKTCPGTFQHSEPGRRESTSVASTGLSPSSARWRFTFPPTCGGPRGVRAQKERDLQAETAAGPQARPAPHRPLGRTRRRSLPDPLPTQASETSPRTSSREDDLAGSSDPVSDPHNA